MPAKRTAVHKRDQAPAPRVETLTVAKGVNYPPGRMLISSPLEIQAVVAQVPKGHVLRLSQLRTHLAHQHNADYTCPLTTGIFLRVAAEAALEEGTSLPWWRVVRDDGKPLDKLPGGPQAQQAQLVAEQVPVLPGRSWRVDVDQAAWQPA